MLTLRDFCLTSFAVATLGVGLAALPAYAFNPQPDPPAKQKMLDSSNSFSKQKLLNDKTLGSCKTGASCGADMNQKMKK